jgi:hypothetical protein
MRLIKDKDLIVAEKGLPGLISANFEYKITSSKATMNYVGPTIPAEVWHQVLSFFRWSYQEYKSESQARLYVNPEAKTWRAWVFPQEARTGMTARELPINETPEKAVERFQTWGVEPGGDWIYFMTVHHHCACGAFQSGTDLNNEKGQDGLHITIGNIDKDFHDIHHRFYLSGVAFNATLDMFWDIGDDLRACTPQSVWGAIAAHQMTRKHDLEFPAQWKANIIETRTPGFFPASVHGSDYENFGAGTPGPSGGRSSYQGGLGYTDGGTWKGKVASRAWDALEEAITDCLGENIGLSEIKECLLWLGTNRACYIITRSCKWKHVEPEDITTHYDIENMPEEWDEQGKISIKSRQGVDDKEPIDLSTAGLPLKPPTDDPTGQTWNGID